MDLENSIFANRSGHGDFVRNAINRLTRTPCSVNIASAFFTEADVINEILDRGCTVRMVVRLGYPTFPDALRRVSALEGVQIRYLTDRSFHPKLYMFGDEGALMGSANLTRAGIGSNQEIMVFLPTADPRFDELAKLFVEYWGQAKVLTDTDIDLYEKAFRKRQKAMMELEHLNEDVEKALGRVVISNIERGLPKQTAENAFIDGFRRTYQEFLDAFKTIREVYEADGRRKYPDDKIPLRLEIDAMMSFVREKHAIGDSWRITDTIGEAARKARVAEYVDKWHNGSWSWFDRVVVPKSYPAVLRVFSTKKAILDANDDTLFAGLDAIHSFHDRLRFFKGGTETLRKEFFAANDSKRVRKSLAYLLHGADDIVERMANMIFHPDYTIREFGRANVQELVGWWNREDLPVVNSRTTKIMHFLGFDVAQMG